MGRMKVADFGRLTNTNPEKLNRFIKKGLLDAERISQSKDPRNKGINFIIMNEKADLFIEFSKGNKHKTFEKWLRSRKEHKRGNCTLHEFHLIKGMPYKKAYNLMKEGLIDVIEHNTRSNNKYEVIWNEKAENYVYEDDELQGCLYLTMKSPDRVNRERSGKIDYGFRIPYLKTLSNEYKVA